MIIFAQGLALLVFCTMYKTGPCIMMKRMAAANKTMFLVMAMGACMLAGAQSPQPSSTFLPDKRVHNFGTIDERNGKVEHTFHFRNRGAAPVVISNVSAWCGCTTVTYTKTPIQPGAYGKVVVAFNPHSRPGSFSKEVVVMTGGGSSYSRVWIKGKVLPYEHPVTEDHPYAFGRGLYMSHKVVAFPPLKKGEKATFSLRLANNTGKPMTIVFKRTPNNRVLLMPEKLTLKPRQRTVIELFYRARRTYGHKRYINVTPYVNGQALKPLRIEWFGTR